MLPQPSHPPQTDHLPQTNHPPQAKPNRLPWITLIVLCVIATAAVLRRAVVLLSPPSPPRFPDAAALDAVFFAHRTMTLIHILPAMCLVLLLPFWFSPRVRRNHAAAHRRITQALFALGVFTGITALVMNTHPIGGFNEVAAILLFDTLFLFSLARAYLLWHRGNIPLHRAWMTRAFAVLLGIATTRPVVGLFVATSQLTHLHPQQFFGTAFWIGFTLTYIAGEAYIRSRPATEL
ncbi:MAG TPA: DUF2306 domain-containing protein [Edaphobacter sp.]|nr:DUF2306 domain-containing protein [Edaphobacter sp.]